GLVEFNVAPLAGATLKGAWLSLYSYSGTGPIKQSAFEFTTGAPVGGMTWNTFPSATQSGFERFGRYELAAGEGVGAYVDSLPAPPADLARIEAAAAGDGVLSLSLVADEDGTEYRRDWGDDGYAGSPPILVLDIGGGCVILTSALPDAEFG